MLIKSANVSKLTRDAATVFRLLNGVVNIYKPSGISSLKLRNMLIANLCRGNFLESKIPNDFIIIFKK